MVGCGRPEDDMVDASTALSDVSYNTLHLRRPSATSSLSSSPSSYNPGEWFNAPLHKRKHPNRCSLPNVAEHPAERVEWQDSSMLLSRSLDQGRRWVHPSLGRRSSLYRGLRASPTETWDWDDSDYDSPRQLPGKKRRSSVTSLAQKFLPMIPSLSRRQRDITPTGSPRLKGIFSSVGPSSRSSSRATSHRNRSTEFDIVDSPVPRQSFQFETINEDDAASVDLLSQQATDSCENHAVVEPIEIERKQTPLLPPINAEDYIEEPPIQSPLQSPTVAVQRVHAVAVIDSPAPTPSGSLIHTPVPSKRPSVASFMKASLSQQMVDSAIHIRSSSNESHSEKWAEMLGHADFCIHPEPYLPEHCSTEAHNQLQADWDLARAEFVRHLAKTVTHFGEGSTTHRLTKQKWNSIDDEWRSNSDLLRQALVKSGELAPGHAPTEPAPLAGLPSFDGAGGKFPKLGDEDIIGAMKVLPKPSTAQTASVSQSKKAKRRSSTKAAFMQFLSGFQFPKLQKDN